MQIQNPKKSAISVANYKPIFYPHPLNEPGEHVLTAALKDLAPKLFVQLYALHLTVFKIIFFVIFSNIPGLELEPIPKNISLSYSLHSHNEWGKYQLYPPLDEHMELLRTSVLGNPLSANPTSLAMTDLVEDTRKYVLRYFKASSDEYIAVFTANASGALKLVGEAYPFTPASHYILTFDNNNSVNGIREFAKAGGAMVTYVPLTRPDLRISRAKLDDILNSVDLASNNLFALVCRWYGELCQCAGQRLLSGPQRSRI